MVDCSEFLCEYTDFRDGFLVGSRREALRAHLLACPSCTRYDQVVREGAELVRELPQVFPSEDFNARLQHRLYHLDDELAVERRRTSEVSLAVAIMLAAAIGLSAWAPTVRPKPSVVSLPPVVAHAPLRLEATDLLFRPGPLIRPSPYSASYTSYPVLDRPTTGGMFFRYSPVGSYVNAPAPAAPR